MEVLDEFRRIHPFAERGAVTPAITHESGDQRG
jgi:hypothetical protein